MNYHSVFLISFLICASCQNDDQQKFSNSQNTSWIIQPSFEEKNKFLSRPEVRDKQIQLSAFEKIKGLWKYLKLENEDGKIIEQVNSNLYFSEGMSWPLDYPYTWIYKNLGEEVYFVGDSIFFTLDGYSYLNEGKFQITDDTLIIKRFNGRNSWTEYYARADYDQTIIDSLYRFGFNKNELPRKWRLREICKDFFEPCSLDDKTFNHIPKFIDLNEYLIHGKLIYSQVEPTSKFKIFRVDHLPEEYGGGFIMILTDLMKKEEHYIYRYYSE